MECTLGIIENHKFVNRGFLIGPYCPIYGVGVVGVTLLLSRFMNNIVLLIILSTILCGGLEYFTSYIMEKLFHARWWDYTNKRFNINGRICLETLVPFVVISVLILKYLNPFIFNNLYKIPSNVLMYVSIILFVLFLIDLCVSFKIISNFKNINRQAKDNTEEISKDVSDIIRESQFKIKNDLNDLKERFIKKSKWNKRLISAFPNVEHREYTRKKRDDK